MERRGFTVVEILVTVALIPTLTAVMVPALGKARSMTRRLNCSNQVRALALGASCYAQDNSGWLPPGPRNYAPDGRWDKDPDRGSPVELFVAGRIGYPGVSSQNGWYGQGLLWQQRAVSEPRLYYCREMETLGWGFAQAWPRNMALAPDRAGEKSVVQGSYIYRGGYASAAGTPDGPCNLNRSSSGEPLFADSPVLGSMVHPGGYIVAYLGGQAEFRRFSKPLVTGTVVTPFWDAVRENNVPASAPR
jgi:prepilin-type N-terminal cleavage/methylation domain-containing protein